MKLSLFNKLSVPFFFFLSFVFDFSLFRPHSKLNVECKRCSLCFFCFFSFIFPFQSMKHSGKRRVLSFSPIQLMQIFGHLINDISYRKTLNPQTYYSVWMCLHAKFESSSGLFFFVIFTLPYSSFSLKFSVSFIRLIFFSRLPNPKVYCYQSKMDSIIYIHVSCENIFYWYHSLNRNMDTRAHTLTQAEETRNNWRKSICERKKKRKAEQWDKNIRRIWCFIQ